MAKSTKTTATKKPVSVFASAQRTTPQASAAASTAALVPVLGLTDYANVCAVEKVIVALKEALRAPVCTAAHERWVDEVVRTEERPENFRGVDRNSEGKIDLGKQASIEARKRATNSPLRDEEVLALELMKVPFEYAPLRAGTSSFMLNAKYDTDPRLEEWGVKMAEMGMPTDIFVQATKPVVTEESLAVAFARKNGESEQEFRARLAKVMGIVLTVGVKPTTDTDPIKALADLAKELKPEFVTEAETKFKEAEAAKRARYAAKKKAA